MSEHITHILTYRARWVPGQAVRIPDARRHSVDSLGTAISRRVEVSPLRASDRKMANGGGGGGGSNGSRRRKKRTEGSSSSNSSVEAVPEPCR